VRVRALLLLLGLLGCERAVEPPTDYRVELAGYRAIEREGDQLVYVFDSERLPTVRTIGPAPALVVATGDPETPLPGATHSHEIHALTEVPDATRIVIRRGRRVVARWRIRWTLVPGVAPPVRRARELQRAGDLAAASIAWRDAARQARAPTETARRLRAAAFVDLSRSRFDAFRAALGEARRLSNGVGDTRGLGLASYYQALADMELGRYRSAARHMTTAIDSARSLGHSTEAAGFESSKALLLRALGRHREALATLESGADTIKNSGDASLVSSWLSNRAWVRLGAVESGAVQGDYSVVRAAFEEAMEPALRAGGDTYAGTIHVNLAWTWHLAGDHAQARLALQRARATRLNRYGSAFAELVTAELELTADRHSAASAAYLRAAETDDDDLVWRALYGLGRLHHATGDETNALRVWTRALAVLERLSRRAGAHDARATFLADRRRLVDDVLRLHLARGELAAALSVADRARARILRAMTVRARLETPPPTALSTWSSRLATYHAARQAFEADAKRGRTLPTDERAAWEARRAKRRRALAALFDRATEVLDLDEAPKEDAGLPELAPAEALLAFVRIGDGWHGFQLASGQVTHQPPRPDPVTPWLEGLRARKHVYVVDGGLEAARDLPRRPDGDGVWGQRLGMSSLPYAGLLLAPTNAPGKATLVLADPTSDLPHAREEGAAVAQALSTRARVGPSATREALVGADARWLHFAGHGVLHTEDPWAAHLKLAGGARLTLTDVLATRPKLGVVVLSGCETGAVRRLAANEVVGLPEAFLAAGAHAVVASDEVLGDAAALRFVRAFYAERGGPSERLRATIAKLRAEGDDAWRPWRVIGRR